MHGTSPLGENPSADEAVARVQAAKAALEEVKAARAKFKTTLAWRLALDEAQTELDAALDADLRDEREQVPWSIPGPDDYREGGEQTTRAFFERLPPDMQQVALRPVVERITVKKGAGTVDDRCSVEWKS